MNLHPSLKVKFNNDFKEVKNSEFVVGTVLIAHAGDNRNGSDITEEAFENAMPSLGLIPVVGNWVPEKNNFGGHDMTIEWQGNDLILKDKTVPFGCVRENHNAEWVEIEEDGEIHKYLKAEIVLWYARYSEPVQKILDDGVNQSMEINVDRYVEKDNGYIQIDNFEYSALCLLGKEVDEYGNKGENDVEPCFPSASVVVDKYALSSDKFKNEFKEFLFAYEQINNNIDGKEDIEVDENKANTEEFEAENEVETVEETEEFENNEVEATENTEGEEFKEEDEEEECKKKDDEDEEDKYKDEDEKEDKYEEKEMTIEELYSILSNEKDLIASENESLKATIQEFEEKINKLEAEKSEKDNLINELQTYYNETELAKKQAEVDEVIQEFESVLKDNEEFENIKQNAMDFEIEALEEKLSAMAWKTKHKSEKTKKNSFSRAVVVPVEEKKENNKYNKYGSAAKYFEK